MEIIRFAVWFMIKNLINTIKRAWKGVLIFLAVFAVFFGIGFCAAVFFEDVPEEEAQGPEDVEEDGDTEYEINEQADLVWDDEGLFIYYDGVKYEGEDIAINVILTAVILFLFVLAINAGNKNAMSIFTMPDVNFLFPSPRKPQSVLLFKMLGQIGSVFVGFLYLIFQFPNLISEGLFTVKSACCFLGAIILICIVNRFIRVFVYVVVNTYYKLKRWVKPICLAICLVPVVILFGLTKLGGMNVMDALNVVFVSDASNFIPIVGWYKGLLLTILNENYLMSVVFLLLVLFSGAVIIYVTWRMKVDFYEDAIHSASETQQKIDQVKAIQDGGMKHGVSYKGRQLRRWEKRRNKDLNFEHKEGAKAFFEKKIGTRRRFYPLGGLWSPTASTYSYVAVGLAAALSILMNYYEFNVVGFVLVGFVFFRSFINPIEEELNRVFVRIVPEPPFRLLSQLMFTEFVDSALDLLPAVLVSGIILETQPIKFILWYLLLVSFYMVFMSIALIVNLLLGAYLPKMLVGSCQVICRMLPLLPIIILATMGILTSSMNLAFAGMIVVNVLCAFIFFLPCPFFFDMGKR